MPQANLTSLGTTIAYLAGFFDGEGCVTVNQTGGRWRSRMYKLVLCVENTDIRPLNLLCEAFGGRVRDLSNRPSLAVKIAAGRAKRAARWELRGLGAEAALRQMLPYLVVKREQAEEVMGFHEKCRGDVGRKEWVKRRLERLKRRDCIGEIQVEPVYEEPSFWGSALVDV